MLRELSSPIHVGSYFAGVGTAVLVVIAGWIILQAQPFAAPVTSPSGAETLRSDDQAAAVSDIDARWLERDRYYESIGLLPGDGEVSASTAASTEITAVDRKLLDEGYLALLMDREELVSQGVVHPADRKFFSGSYANYAALAADADPLSHVNPADRKFFTNDFVLEE
jgi:hypothetical protein